MQVLWQKQVEIYDLWEPDCFGVFHKEENGITFFFKNRSSLLALSEENTKPQMLHTCCNGEKLPLPHDWAIVEVLDASVLLVAKDQGFELKNRQFSDQIPSQIQLAYLQRVRPEKYYEEAPQHLGEYTIFHKGNCGYICKKNDTELWQFLGKAYLYTDMMYWEDRVFFGTGGRSGYFYVLDIRNGSPLVSIKTGGTRCFIHADNLCYILKNEKTAHLCCIDLLNGQTVSQCDLPGLATINSRITMIDNRIHTITFDYIGSKVRGFTWSCVDI